MPKEAELLEQAEQEGWSDERVAAALEMEVQKVPEWRMQFRRALAIVDAPNPVEAFRNGVRFLIEDAVEEGLADSKSIEKLVTQICYRDADLAVLLERDGVELGKYSEALRKEPEEVEDLEE